MKCYYHKIDLDGKCSAAIVKRKYPDCELIGVNYPDRPNLDKIEPGETVFVVDFSFEPKDMLQIFSNLIWIDHHKSAIEKAEGWVYEKAEGKREIGKAGCELTWEYLFPDEPMPEAVRLLGRYDVWDHSDRDVLKFQYGMRLEDWMPEAPAWQSLFNKNTELNIREDVIRQGIIVTKYEQRRNFAYAKAMAFPVEFEGHKAWAINKALSNSKIFETLPNAQKRPLWILFSYKNGLWRYSLYSAPGSGIDVSEIAVKYGGGGHAGAAGFKSEQYLLKEV